METSLIGRLFARWLGRIPSIAKNAGDNRTAVFYKIQYAQSKQQAFSGGCGNFNPRIFGCRHVL
jgi:hypothetical protein